MRGSRILVGLTALILFARITREQVTEAPLSFEVATVKPSRVVSNGSYISRGGPGTPDPGQFSMHYVSLRVLLIRALGMKNYQLSGPDWLASEAFEIVAKVPLGATTAQLDTMIKSLLVERFQLAYHHEAKEMSVYELLVGKDGPKLKESDLSIQPAAREPGEPAPRPSTDEKGFPVLPQRRTVQLIGRVTDGIAHWAANQQLISELASFLERPVNRPVVDKTGLTGQYDVRLSFDDTTQTGPGQAGPAADGTRLDDTPSGGPNVFKAVEQQLGLKLQPAKDPIDVLVIDHIEKQPTEN